MCTKRIEEEAAADKSLSDDEVSLSLEIPLVDLFGNDKLNEPTIEDEYWRLFGPLE